nr:hypothetical protein [uncultured Sphaerochaeta sp.]
MTKAAWDKKNTTRLNLKLNNSTDRDILDYLTKQQSKQGAIKAALRRTIHEDKEKAP